MSSYIANQIKKGRDVIKKEGCTGVLKRLFNQALGQANLVLGVIILAEVAILNTIFAEGALFGIDTSFEITMFSFGLASQSFGTVLSQAGLALRIGNFVVQKIGGDLSKFQWLVPRMIAINAAFMLGLLGRMLIFPSWVYLKYGDEIPFYQHTYSALICSAGQFSISLWPFINERLGRKCASKSKSAAVKGGKDAKGIVIQDAEVGETPSAGSKPSMRVFVLNVFFFLLWLGAVAGPTLQAKVACPGDMAQPAYSDMSIKAFKKGLPAFKKLSDQLLADNSTNSTLDPLTGYAEIYCDPWFAPPTEEEFASGGPLLMRSKPTPVVCAKGQFCDFYRLQEPLGNNYGPSGNNYDEETGKMSCGVAGSSTCSAGMCFPCDDDEIYIYDCFDMLESSPDGLPFMNMHILGMTDCNIRCLAADPVKNVPRPADPDREGRTRASYLKALGKTACIF